MKTLRGHSWVCYVDVILFVFLDVLLVTNSGRMHETIACLMPMANNTIGHYWCFMHADRGLHHGPSAEGRGVKPASLATPSLGPAWRRQLA